MNKNIEKYEDKDTSLNIVDASDRTARAGIIKIVPIDNSLGRTTAIGSSKVYNVVNPFIITWQHLIPSFQACSPNPLQVTSFMGWLEAVQARTESEGNIANLPAIRTLDFFENLS